MEYIMHLGIVVGIYIILSVGLNLVVGYTGLLSLSQAAFYGIGAYTGAILITQLKINFFIALPISILFTAFISFLMGVVLSKFRDDYYALVSIGFNVIVLGMLLNWHKLTHGALGISGIARPNISSFVFSDTLSFLLLTTVFAVIFLFISAHIVRSSFGRTLKAIREDEKTAQIFGYNTNHFKLVIFIISAAMSGAAGVLFATYITFITPSSFSVDESIFILTITILGGLANLRGSVFGAVIIILLPEMLRFAGMPNEIAAQMRQAIYGLALVVLMFYRPQGLFGEYKL